MEKERKGLFGRLLDFWKEKFETGATNGIGFWNDTDIAENHLAEMGTIVSLTQEEVKKTFWEETAESAMDEKREETGILAAEKKYFLIQKEEKQQEGGKRKTEEMPAEDVKKRGVSRMFLADGFWSGERKTEDTEESSLSKAFIWEKPEEDRTVRSIIPVGDERKQEEAPMVEAVNEIRMEENPKREEKQAEAQIDIEKLMRQMTKKLWEERESCSRRLR